MICQEGDPNPLELENPLAGTLKHSSHLMVTPLDQSDFIPRLFALRNQADPAGLRQAAIQHDSALESRQIFGREFALQFDVISARDL